MKYYIHVKGILSHTRDLNFICFKIQELIP